MVSQSLKLYASVAQDMKKRFTEGKYTLIALALPLNKILQKGYLCQYVGKYVLNRPIELNTYTL